MDFEHFVAFNLALIASIVSPGPAFLVAIKTTLSSGLRAGLSIGFGLGVVAASWTLVALFGLEVLFQLFPWAYTIVKTIGAIYLIYVAYKMWCNARENIESCVKPASHVFWQGVFINILNPKSVMFAAAVLVVIFPQNMSVFENGLVVINHLVVEILFYSGLAFAMNSDFVSKRYLNAKGYIDRISSGILGFLGFLGFRLLIER